MKTLVTGSTGLVGSTLVERLIGKGYEVRALARKTSDLSHLKTTRAEIVFGDITDYDTLPPVVQGIDIVFHTAARVIPGWGAWEEYEKTNVEGTENMLRASAEAAVRRFLHISSFTVYGEACQKGDIPADESTPCEARKTPSTYYDYSKLLAEQACWEYHRQGKMKVSMIRIGSAYGPRDRLLADRVYKQTSFPIMMWPGKANPRYAIVYVSDIVELAILAATTDKAIGQAYNVAGPEPVRLKEFTNAMIRARGAKRSWVTMPYPVAWFWCYLMETFAKLRRSKQMPFLTLASLCSINNEGYLDGSKAKNELGWEQKVSIDEGTRLYVKWRRSQPKN
jgi:nucleoside-diphosphate-sugar epimerase